MRQLALSNEVDFALVDDADYEAVLAHRWHRGSGGDAQRNVKRDDRWTTESLHVFLMGKRFGYEVDHKNGNKLDNRRENLRWATDAENARNCKRKGASSRFKGVTWAEGKRLWRVRIMFLGKGVHVGYFTNEEDAARAYDRKALELFGEFARLNFPT